MPLNCVCTQVLYSISCSTFFFFNLSLFDYVLWMLNLTPKFSGKVVAKFCAKYLHQQVLKNEAYIAGDIGTSLQESFFRLEHN